MDRQTCWTVDRRPVWLTVQNERYLNDIHRLIQMAEPMREEPLEPLACEWKPNVQSMRLHMSQSEVAAQNGC